MVMKKSFNKISTTGCSIITLTIKSTKTVVVRSLDGVGNLIGQVDLAEGDPEGAAPDWQPPKRGQETIGRCLGSPSSQCYLYRYCGIVVTVVLSLTLFLLPERSIFQYFECSIPNLTIILKVIKKNKCIESNRSNLTWSNVIWEL